MFLSWYEGFSDVQDYIYIAHRIAHETVSYELNRKSISRFHGAIEIELVINGEFEVDINDVSDLERIAVNIEIDADSKKDILKDLKMLGIANNTIYLDFDRTAMAIASDRKVNWVNIY